MSEYFLPNALGLLAVASPCQSGEIHCAPYDLPIESPDSWYTSGHQPRVRDSQTPLAGWVEHSKYIPHGHVEEHLAYGYPGAHIVDSLIRVFAEPTSPLHPDTTPPPSPCWRLALLPEIDDDGCISESDIWPPTGRLEDTLHDNDFSLLLRNGMSGTAEMLQTCYAHSAESSTLSDFHGQVQSYHRRVHDLFITVAHLMDSWSGIHRVYVGTNDLPSLASFQNTLSEILKLTDIIVQSGGFLDMQQWVVELRNHFSKLEALAESFETSNTRAHRFDDTVSYSSSLRYSLPPEETAATFAVLPLANVDVNRNQKKKMAHARKFPPRASTLL